MVPDPDRSTATYGRRMRTPAAEHRVAIQKVGDTQDTNCSSAPGLTATGRDHRVPSNRKTLPEASAAIQKVVDAQDTAMTPKVNGRFSRFTGRPQRVPLNTIALPAMPSTVTQNDADTHDTATGVLPRSTILPVDHERPSNR